MRTLLSSILFTVWIFAAPPTAAFVPGGALSTRTALRMAAVESNDPDALMPTAKAVQTVAVAGATGKLGQCVVKELIKRNVSNIVCLVRSTDKAQNVWGKTPPRNLKIVPCDLSDEKALQKALNGVDAALWCATGFSPSTSWVERLQKLFGLATQQPSIDTVGLPLLAKALPQKKNSTYPRVVMCSSAGVTRPQWTDDKKERLVGAAEIPIVRLNPFGILDIKLASEDTLRDSNVPYCIVRPSGLNDEWPAGSRPLLSQGDVAVGRICRADVATVMVDVLSAPEAVGKTFEVTAVADYPPPRSLRPVLRRLVPDGTPLDETAVTATYQVLQQLLPGEKQAANELAMGQTYEQLDKGETGRFGKRGEENLNEVPMQPSSGIR